MTFKNALKATGRGVGSALNATAIAINTVAEENRQIEMVANVLMQKTPGLELTQAKLVARTLVRNVEEIKWK